MTIIITLTIIKIIFIIIPGTPGSQKSSRREERHPHPIQPTAPGSIQSIPRDQSPLLCIHQTQPRLLQPSFLQVQSVPIDHTGRSQVFCLSSRGQKEHEEEKRRAQLRHEPQGKVQPAERALKGLRYS